jgi:hypothetical protein
MADGRASLAEYLKGDCVGAFRPECFYESKTDSLIYYGRNVPSYSNRVNKYLTLFLADEDDALVGFEIKGLSIITKAIEDLGYVEVADPVAVGDGDGATVDLSVVVRCSLVVCDESVGEHYEPLEKLSRGVKIRPSHCMQ